MLRLILHIGPWKTGTTSIQETLVKEPAVLAAHGLGYARLGRSNHGTLMHSLFADEPERLPWVRREGRLTRADADAFNARTRAALERELGRPRTRAVIISGEGMAGMSEPEIARMLDFFRGFADNVEVIAFVRPPVSFYTSIFQQQSQSGSCFDDRNRVRAAYRVWFEKYLRLLPQGAVKLRLYHRSKLPGGCAVRAFLEACGVPAPASASLTVASWNESLSRPAVALLLALNELLPNRPDGRFHPLRPRYPNYYLIRLLRWMGGPRFRLPGELIDDYLARDAADIAWMSDRLGIDLRALDDPIDRTIRLESLVAAARLVRSLRTKLGLSAPRDNLGPL